ncbi:MAG: regulator of sirC expression with transglutaminase-like and TPR domain [Candidatus Poriferisodalaceae bacterium]|jgi:regulator of sirC expression with transglutaminase-like and TPR domain
MDRRRQKILDRFAALVSADGMFALGEAALLIAAYERPDDVDIDASLEMLDDFASLVKNPTLDGLSDVIFFDLGFAGNTDNYYDLGNSHLDLVLDRRLGIPITLAIVLIEVGLRAGVPLFGVGMPGHFLVGDRVDDQLFVDPFRRGARLGVEDCEKMFRTMQPTGAQWSEAMLAETPRNEILQRMLNNLRIVQQQTGANVSFVRTMELMVLVPGTPPAERRQLAAALERVGRVGEAVEHLETLADVLGGEEAEQLRHAATRLLGRLN